ncbi:hypothetical protein [Lapillicoccus jejuensis]|uniref:Uncharacterized protein n=1 Tax=Lapillicoccus jejuensis TaxID=402171 RepID=A0A542DYI0_9MICO|nr:hypothetical protein [Lapillicoccus jejuensis]TQJ08155.1 hypothetical protein FB458_1239 [Lapillicoccus jejuensis]
MTPVPLVPVELAAMADADGLVRVADLRRYGVTAREIARWSASGVLKPLVRGWYSLAQDDDRSAWERRRHDHAQRTRALVLQLDGAAVASHHSALVMHGLPTYAADLRQVHLMRTQDDHSRRRPGLTLHRCVDGAGHDATSVEPAVAVVQAGLLGSAVSSLVAADAAVHRGLVTTDALDEALDLLRGPGSAGVRRILGHVDGKAESPGETRTRLALTLMGLTLESQYAVTDGDFLAVSDLRVAGTRLLVEFDGFVKYSRADPYRLERCPSDVLVTEKVREDRLRELGWVVLRIIWSELDDVAVLRRRVERALALADATAQTLVTLGTPSPVSGL